MTSTIAGVKLITLAYTWSQTSIAYFISTCGDTTPAKEPYITEYEDTDGQIQQKLPSTAASVRLLQHVHLHR